MLRLIAHAQRTAELCDAIRHSTQTKVAGPRPVGGEADAVVGDRNANPLLVALHGDRDPRGLRVAQRVDEAFLHHPIDRKRHARSEIGRQLVLQIDGDARMDDESSVLNPDIEPDPGATAALASRGALSMLVTVCASAAPVMASASRTAVVNPLAIIPRAPVMCLAAARQ